VAHHDFSGIQGFEALRAIYGDEVGFHDAEVTRLELIRGGHGTSGVGLRLDIHMFSPIGVEPETRRYRLGNHHIVRLLFQGIQDLELGGFNHQNALGLSTSSPCVLLGTARPGACRSRPPSGWEPRSSARAPAWRA